jgi:cysteine-rich repeat protein
MRMQRVRTIWRSVARLALVLIAFGGHASAESAPAERGSGSLAPLGPKLTERLSQNLHPGEKVPIQVSLDREGLGPLGPARRARVRVRQDRVLSALAGRAFDVGYRLESVSGFSGRAPIATIDALRRHPDVVAIHLDYEVRGTLAQGNALIGADTLHSSGWTGAGVNVAVLDSGIDTDHSDLVDDLVAEQCFCDNHPSPAIGCCPNGGQVQAGAGSAEDDNGHGTHTAGMISSGGMVSGVGVAPDAGIVAIKVLGANGNGATSSIAAALDWVVTNHVTFDIRVVNLSLGDGGEYNDALASPCSGTLSATAIGLLHAADVVVFAASGNDGYDDGISEPACVTEAISVGGVYDANVGGVGWCGNADCSVILCSDVSGPDVFVCHSNSDEILDILAPDWRTTSPDVGGGTSPFGGTSAASPYAAGQAALLLEADPTLQPEDIRNLLASNGPSVTNPENGLSFPRSDVEAALASLGVCGDSIVDFGEDCDDGNTASADCCSSTCLFEAVASPCDDEDACTSGDECDGAGACSSGAPVDCDDLNGCTDDACDALTGCVSAPNAAACDDGDACTTTDVCALGTCTGGPALGCNDLNGCTDDTCDPVIGCVFVDNVAPCDDANACTAFDACALGSCVGGAALDCNDADVCTDDSCDPELGCVQLDNTAACDDNDPCTAESCDALTGCAHALIEGCPAPEVPAGSNGSRVLLLALILGSACLLVSEARRRDDLSGDGRS